MRGVTFFSVVGWMLLGLGCDDAEPSGAPDPVLVDTGMLDAGMLDADLPDTALPDAEVDMLPDAAIDAGEPAYTARLDLPATPHAYADQPLPEHYTVETMRFAGQVPAINDDNTPADNPITNAGATLGRVLFYDTNLSINREVACASCHLPEHGFSDDRELSIGFDGRHTARHSMGLVNARFYRAEFFFWDQRAATLEEQVLEPFQDPIEMGMTLEGLLARIEAGDYYPALFEAAFGDAAVTPERISKALAQFVRSIVSTRSKYDEGRAMVPTRAADFPNFTAEENRGKRLFVNPPPRGGLACFFCHQGEAFIAIEATNNGLDADFSIDGGYGAITNRFRDGGKFKVPSLRNVELRPPYMHDGRFATLEEVVEHYSTGIQPNPNLGPPFGVRRDGTVRQLNLSEVDKRALVAFLKTLSDREIGVDPRFTDPFIREE